MSSLRGLWEHRPSALYDHIAVPVMLVPAEGPRGVFADTKREAVERAARLLPQSRVEWFSPADHDLHAQFPERFAGVVHEATIDGFFT
jgi:pimeloyl-ACP methyl ester carboxylesterase